MSNSGALPHRTRVRRPSSDQILSSTPLSRHQAHKWTKVCPCETLLQVETMAKSVSNREDGKQKDKAMQGMEAGGRGMEAGGSPAETRWKLEAALLR